MRCIGWMVQWLRAAVTAMPSPTLLTVHITETGADLRLHGNSRCLLRVRLWLGLDSNRCSVGVVTGVSPNGSFLLQCCRRSVGRPQGGGQRQPHGGSGRRLWRWGSNRRPCTNKGVKDIHRKTQKKTVPTRHRTRVQSCAYTRQNTIASIPAKITGGRMSSARDRTHG